MTNFVQLLDMEFDMLDLHVEQQTTTGNPSTVVRTDQLIAAGSTPLEI